MFDGNVKIMKTNNYNHNTMTNTTSNNFALSNAGAISTIDEYGNHDQISVISCDGPGEVSVCIGEKENADDNDVGCSQNAIANDGQSKKIHDKKIAKNDVLLTEAQNIINNFILNDSKFEVNIAAKTKRAIIFNLNEIKTIELEQQDFKNRLKCIFDEAYNEVINSLFLNSYTNYISQKRNST